MKKEIYLDYNFIQKCITLIWVEKLYQILLFKICKTKNNWIIKDFIKRKIQEIKFIVQDRKVVCGLSGGDGFFCHSISSS